MFPKDSPFYNPMDQGAGIEPPLRTPEENQRIADERRANPKSVTVPLIEYERWIEDLDALSDMRGGEAISDVALNMRSYLV